MRVGSFIVKTPPYGMVGSGSSPVGIIGVRGIPYGATAVLSSESVPTSSEEQPSGSDYFFTNSYLGANSMWDTNGDDVSPKNSGSPDGIFEYDQNGDIQFV